jgi:outer membrane protein OmpA-like peptidoglycan-associated protein
MKKFVSMLLGGVAVASLAVPAMSIVLDPEAGKNVPSVFAKVVGGKVVYDRTSTAYSSVTFNEILKAYGLELAPEMVGSVPTSYATAKDGTVVFNRVGTAYAPAGYHTIFTSYGLELKPEEVTAKLAGNDYAKVVNGQIVFGKSPTAYDGETLALILSAYSLPVVEVPPVVEAPPPAPPEPVKWVLNSDYMFDFDKAVIREHYFVLLDHIVEAMTAEPRLRFEIQGHTCSMGPNAYNQKLSERRAQAIYTYLVEKGIDQSRLTAIGFGEEKPAFPNDTRENRAKNRRVELVEF